MLSLSICGPKATGPIFLNFHKTGTVGKMFFYSLNQIRLTKKKGYCICIWKPEPVGPTWGYKIKLRGANYHTKIIWLLFSHNIIRGMAIISMGMFLAPFPSNAVQPHPFDWFKQSFCQTLLVCILLAPRNPKFKMLSHRVLAWK